MDLLRERNLPFGASICYTRQNYDSITSDEFIQFLVDKGVLFSWIFTYMPVGVGAPVELMATAEQRAGMYHKVRDELAPERSPSSSPTSGTTASTRAAASPAPAATCTSTPAATSSPARSSTTPTATSARRACSSATRARCSRAYRAHQPFNKNMLRPCPLLDNPGALAEIVHGDRRSSPPTTRTPRTSSSSCRKTVPTAEKWAVTSQGLWDNSPKGKWVAELEAEGKDPTGWAD
jgi:hypothetical protein